MNHPSSRAHRVPSAGRFDAVADELHSARTSSGIRAAAGLHAAGHATSLARRRRNTRASPLGGGAQRTEQLPCRVYDADLWFAKDPDDIELAKSLCADCPVRQACLAGACDRSEPVGVWGGQLFDGGRIVGQKRRRGRPRKGGTISPASRSDVCCA